MHDTSISTVTPPEEGTVKIQVFSIDMSINSLRQVLDETHPRVLTQHCLSQSGGDQVMNVVPELKFA